MKKFKVQTPRDKYLIKVNSENEAIEIAKSKEIEIAKKYSSLPGEVQVTDVTDWKDRKQKLSSISITKQEFLEEEINRQIEDDLISPEEFKSILR